MKTTVISNNYLFVLNPNALASKAENHIAAFKRFFVFLKKPDLQIKLSKCKNSVKTSKKDLMAWLLVVISGQSLIDALEYGSTVNGSLHHYASPYLWIK